mmetsp:Transcript_39915/g.94727  ORF Transcript_39915/g.94727 Transcript_39915/m.94727 type:complete len:314 (-) Transcript_39915:517-1458(-)
MASVARARRVSTSSATTHTAEGAAESEGRMRAMSDPTNTSEKRNPPRSTGSSLCTCWSAYPTAAPPPADASEGIGSHRGSRGSSGAGARLWGELRHKSGNFWCALRSLCGNAAKSQPCSIRLACAPPTGMRDTSSCVRGSTRTLAGSGAAPPGITSSRPKPCSSCNESTVTSDSAVAAACHADVAAARVMLAPAHHTDSNGSCCWYSSPPPYRARCNAPGIVDPSTPSMFTRATWAKHSPLSTTTASLTNDSGTELWAASGAASAAPSTLPRSASSTRVPSDASVENSAPPPQASPPPCPSSPSPAETSWPLL